MEPWDYPQVSSKDGLQGISVGEIIDMLQPLVEADDKEAFIETLNRFFLGGAWGFLFQMLEKVPGGYQWRIFAKDIRALVWQCLRRGADQPLGPKAMISIITTTRHEPSSQGCPSRRQKPSTKG